MKKERHFEPAHANISSSAETARFRVSSPDEQANSFIIDLDDDGTPMSGRESTRYEREGA